MRNATPPACQHVSEAGACEKRAVVLFWGHLYCARHALDAQLVKEREKKTRTVLGRDGGNNAGSAARLGR
jgi:hypothetical protein